MEGFKYAKTSLEIILLQSKDPVVKNTAPTVKTGKKWNPRETVQHAQGTVQHRDIIGQIQSWRAGFRLGDSWKAWGNATLLERRQVATKKRKKRKLVEQHRLLKQSKGNGWTVMRSRWDEMSANHITFIVGATYNDLSTPQNLNSAEP